MNLRLHDDDAGAEALGDVGDFRGIGGFFSARHGHAVLREDCLSLILVDFHSGNKRAIVTCEPS